MRTEGRRRKWKVGMRKAEKRESERVRRWEVGSRNSEWKSIEQRAVRRGQMPEDRGQMTEGRGFLLRSSDWGKGKKANDE